MRKQKHKKMAFHLRRYSSHGRRHMFSVHLGQRLVIEGATHRSSRAITVSTPSVIPMFVPKLSRGRTSPNVQCVCVDGELSAILLK